MRRLSRVVLPVAALAVASLPAEAGAQPAAEPSWGAVSSPSAAPAAVFGSYDRGCIGGALALPLSGPGFEVMRPTRNRYYGHPNLLAYIGRLADAAPAAGWPGLLLGDLAQPRGGPMATGHRSHQIGLDVDIWLTPAPQRALSEGDRETMAPESLVTPDGQGVTSAWSEAHEAFLRVVVLDAAVDRVFVNAAIKRQLCRSTGGEGDWLQKVRPWWGHDAHVHVRLRCPAGDDHCRPQDPVPAGTGCDAGLDWWLSAEALEERRKAAERPPVARTITLADLPEGCMAIIEAP